MTKEKLALEIIGRLKEEYPDAGCTLDYDQAWKLLVSVRLAAQCTDARVNVVVEDLYDKYPDVDALAEAEAEDIEKIAWNLARFYRLSLNRGQDLISIGEEVEHVQVYVNIQKFHYDDAVHLEVDIPEELKSLACLNIILQPFVENAILHGIGERTEISQCSISIRVRQQGDDILFTVKDDGPGMTQKQMEEAEMLDISQIKGGYGVKNITFRIKLCFGEEYGVRYESVLGEGTTAFILIPAMTMEEAEKKIM